MNSDKKLIEFNNVSFKYPGKDFLFRDLSFEVVAGDSGTGQIVALMGASGAGKSTFLNLIVGTNTPTSGQINIPSNAVISYIPQEPVLFEHLTPLQNATYFSNTSAYRKLYDKDFFDRMAAALGMENLLKQSKSILKLSGGEKQRIMLLRAMSIRPTILLLDEPTTGLDAEAKLQFMNLVREIVITHNLLAIYCTHNVTESCLLADQVIFISTKNINGVNVFRQKITEFVEQPSTTDALQSLRYPAPNLFLCYADEDRRVLPCIENNHECFYLSIQEEQILFSQTNGLDYSIITENPLYVQLSVNGQMITISATSFYKRRASKLLINGTCLQYDRNHLYIGATIIHEGYLK